MARTLTLIWLTFRLTAADLDRPGAEIQVRVDGRMQTVRQVNGRWWTSENREVRKTGATRWVPATNIGGNLRQFLRFDHHQPVDADRVDLLDRTMGPDQVRSLLGPPNVVFPSNRPETRQVWFYYGPGGFKLTIQFSWKGLGIHQATVEANAQSPAHEVQHLAFRILGNGNDDIDEESPRNRALGMAAESYSDAVAVEQGLSLLSEYMASRHGGGALLARAKPSGTANDAAPAKDPAMRSLSAGMPRTRVIELLGEPSTRYTIHSVEGSRETLVYVQNGGQSVTRVIVVEGKLSEVQFPEPPRTH